MNRFSNTMIAGALLFLQACAMDAGDLGEPVQGVEKAAQPTGAAMTEVSPELFDLIAAWSAGDALGVAAGEALAEDLLAYVDANDPDLVAEAMDLLAREGAAAKGIGTASVCSCQLLATVEANPIQASTEHQADREMRDWPNRNKVKWEYVWDGAANGAAHSGRLYRYHYHGLSAHERNRTNFTQMRVQLLCKDAAGVRCSGSCQGQMYLLAEYGTRVYGYGETGGVWDKAAQASAADAAVLSYARPFEQPVRKFEKLASVTHYATKTSFNIDEVANVAAAAVTIVQAIVTSNPTQITADFVSKLVKSLAGLISREGNDGSTDREMYASWDSTRDGYFDISFSSTENHVHTFRLESSASVKNRGWGGTNEDESKYSSAYLMAAGFDLYTCDAHLVAPAPATIWRYASTTGAPYGADTLRSMAQSFFNVLGFSVNVSGPSGSSGFGG